MEWLLLIILFISLPEGFGIGLLCYDYVDGILSLLTSDARERARQQSRNRTLFGQLAISIGHGVAKLVRAKGLTDRNESNLMPNVVGVRHDLEDAIKEALREALADQSWEGGG